MEGLLMARNDVETYRVPGGWANRLQGTFTDQDDAAEVGRAIARYLRVEHFTRAKSGRWRLRDTFTGHDPRRSKG